MRALVTILAILFGTSTFAAPMPQVNQEAHPKSLPAIGKWMIDDQGEIAHWLGIPFENHKLQEPINIIVEVHASSPDEANQKFILAMSLAGYENRKGHTSGYQALIDHQKSIQLAPINNFAFSNEPYLLDNNHARIFGPAFFENKYIYTGSLSREDTQRMKKLISFITRTSTPLHTYESFNLARDCFAQALVKSGVANLLGRSFLNNAYNDDTLTTGDHDGYAWILEIP